MKRARISWCAAPLAAVSLLVGGCSKPTAPGVHALSGHLTLTGYLVGSDAKFAGTRIIGDANGVPVELVFGDQVVARTVTVNGVYRFAGIAPGGYVARAVAGPLIDETNTLTIGDRDLAAADTLRLAARGDLTPFPNPTRSYTQIGFFLSDSATVDMRIVDLAGGEVRHIVSGFTYPPGTTLAGWDGNDDAGHRAGAGMYWLIFHAAGSRASLGMTDDRIALLFR
jgi:hypothetical protein